MDQLRKIYRRAVSVPLENVEQIWRDYDQFENQINKMTVSDPFPCSPRAFRSERTDDIETWSSVQCVC